MGMEEDMHTTPEVIFMLPQGNAAEAPRDQLITLIVTGVLDRHIPEETMVHPYYLVRMRMHLHPQTYHAPRPLVSGPGVLAEAKFHQNVLQNRHCQSRHNLLVLLFSFQLREAGVKISGRQKFGPAGALYNICDDTINV